MTDFRQFGIIGYPLAHSFSQRYFTHKFENENICACYTNFEIDNVTKLKTILADNLDLVGLNVTLPYKQTVMPLLDGLSDEAKAIGAVNVIRVERRGGETKLIGYNSDVFGFMNSIRPLLKESHHKALVLGTGGASKAIVYGLKQLGLDTRLVSRKRSDETIAYEDLDEKWMSAYTVIVNCTPLGTFPDINSAVDIPYHLLTSEHLLYDLVYNPELTEFLKRGQKYGAQIKNGAEMLELQAIKAWEIWNQ